MCEDADEPSTIWNEEQRTARKEYACFACREPIQVGDAHRYTRSLYDGMWDQWRHCLRCAALLDALVTRNAGLSSVALDLDCGETWEEPPPEVAALAFATREDMQRLARAEGR